MLISSFFRAGQMFCTEVYTDSFKLDITLKREKKIFDISHIRLKNNFNDLDFDKSMDALEGVAVIIS